MKDEQLNELLRALPRERASDEFTSRVLARVDEPSRPVHAGRWLAAAALVALVIIGGLIGRNLVERQRQEERLAAVLAERAEITRELREIKRLSEEVSPVVYLGSGADADYLVDFRQLEVPARSVQQTSWQPNTY